MCTACVIDPARYRLSLEMNVVVYDEMYGGLRHSLNDKAEMRTSSSLISHSKQLIVYIIKVLLMSVVNINISKIV
jgi:hypothetical protein